MKFKTMKAKARFLYQKASVGYTNAKPKIKKFSGSALKRGKMINKSLAKPIVFRGSDFGL